MTRNKSIFAVITIFSLILCFSLLPFSSGLENQLLFNSQVAQFAQAISPAMEKFSFKSKNVNKNNNVEVSDNMLCLGCVVGIRMVEVLAIREQKPASEVLGKLCDKITGAPAWANVCKVAVSLFGTLVRFAFSYSICDCF